MKNKIVLITGSSVGIGRYTAYRFSKEGARIIITYNMGEREAHETAIGCKKLGAGGVSVFHLDIRDNESIKNLVENMKKEYGYIDILINNAGVVVWKPLKEQSFEDIENQIRVNLEGLIKLTKLMLPFVKEMIINIGSGAGKAGFESLTVYCATKFGLRGFTQALAQEIPSLKIYCVNPGMTATRMTNFQGVHPERVAEIIFNTAKGIYKKPSGSDIDVWEYL